MSLSHLDKLFRPTSIAVIGASNKPQRAGYVVMRNLQAGGFSGPIMPVTPKYQAVAGVLAYPSIEALPIVPDLAVLCVHASRVVEIVEQLGQYGTKAAVVLAAGLNNRVPNGNGESYRELMLAKAQRWGMRILGPNSLGFMAPALGVNASFSPLSAMAGKVAFVSQSAAVCTTVLDWAGNRGVGFSLFVSLGDAADIDFAELLDYLGRDHNTSAILLYIDSIRDARRFLSAARAASRIKPVLVIKSGRTAQGSRAVHNHTGGSAGNDIVYDAAIRRAGMLRVQDTTELFAALETLSHATPMRGERLMIVTNGGGPGVMAVDTLLERGGKLAEISAELQQQLDKVLPSTWSGSNPIDIVGDAPISRYLDTIKILLDNKDFDALLIQHSPSAIAPGTETAQALIELINQHPRRRYINILTNWAGETLAYDARRLFNKGGIPTYRTPEGAAAAYMHMVEYNRNQKLLMETPSSLPADTRQDSLSARNYLDELLTQGKLKLETHEAAALLATYGINTMATSVAYSAEEAVTVADTIGYPVVLKVLSHQILHKSEVQGVVLNLASGDEVLNAAIAMQSRIAETFPEVEVEGFVLQAMAKRAGAQELRIAVQHDATFGPVIMLGEGGSQWDIQRDAVVALPPLNMGLARYLVIQAIKSGRLHQRGLPETLHIPSLCALLTQVSQLIVDCPQVLELDINPLLVSGAELTVLDISVRLTRAPSSQSRLAIRPYPKELEEQLQLRDGSVVVLRPILPEDEPMHREFTNAMSAEDRYRRFFGEVASFSHEDLARMTQIDYDREMAFIAVAQVDGQAMTLAVARASADPDNFSAEFAIAVRSDRKGNGLGRVMMEKLIGYFKAQGTQQLAGMTMLDNHGMIELARRLGFSVKRDLEEGVVEMVLPLQTQVSP